MGQFQYDLFETEAERMAKFRRGETERKVAGWLYQARRYHEANPDPAARILPPEPGKGLRAGLTLEQMWDMGITPDQIDQMYRWGMVPTDLYEDYRQSWRRAAVRFSNTYEDHETTPLRPAVVALFEKKGVVAC